MSDVRAVGIVGAGTIGRAVGARLQAGLPGLALLGYVVRAPKGDLDAREFASVGDLLDARAQIVVEAASHDALRECGEPALAAGADLVCTSVGALADPGLRSRLWAAGVASGARLVVPSGAVGALDVLGAAAEDGLDEVVIEQRKPPRTLLPVDEADALTEPRIVFDGTVTEVVSLYPKTTNVAAAVALAGLGFDATRARVVADPVAPRQPGAAHARAARSASWPSGSTTSPRRTRGRRRSPRRASSPRSAGWSHRSSSPGRPWRARRRRLPRRG